MCNLKTTHASSLNSELLIQLLRNKIALVSHSGTGPAVLFKQVIVWTSYMAQQAVVLHQCDSTPIKSPRKQHFGWAGQDLWSRVYVTNYYKMCHIVWGVNWVQVISSARWMTEFGYNICRWDRNICFICLNKDVKDAFFESGAFMDICKYSCRSIYLINIHAGAYTLYTSYVN